MVDMAGEISLLASQYLGCGSFESFLGHGGVTLPGIEELFEFHGNCGIKFSGAFCFDVADGDELDRLDEWRGGEVLDDVEERG